MQFYCMSAVDYLNEHSAIEKNVWGKNVNEPINRQESVCI